ncbi:hypothetical protein GCM10010273_20250 [Streptomyces lavendulocolor]
MPPPARPVRRRLAVPGEGFRAAARRRTTRTATDLSPGRAIPSRAAAFAVVLAHPGSSPGLPLRGDTNADREAARG